MAAQKPKIRTAKNGDFSEISVAMPWGHVAGRWYGDQSKRPLLALHGWLDNCGTYARLAPLLQPYTSLLCIDLPGHGLSSHLPVGMIYHNMEFVRVVLRLMKAYKWDKISLMGHSMGGATAFVFAALFPDRVDMLIQLDIIVERDVKIDIMANAIRHIIERSERDNDRILQYTPMDEPPSYTFDECERLLHKGSEFSVPIENCKYLLERNLSKSVKYPNKYYFSRDGRLKFSLFFNIAVELAQVMSKRICRSGMPHLVIQGGASTNISAAIIEKILPLFKTQNDNFERYIVPDATHHLHLNNPNEVASIIIDFWKRKNWLETKELSLNDEEESERNFQSKL